MTIIIPFFLINASFFVKMSITHFYIVLFPQSTWLHKTCKVQLLLLTLCFIATIIPVFLSCIPFEYTWNKSLVGGGKCIDMKNFWLGTSVVALAFDLSCVLLPIPVFWRLKMEVRKKVKLTVLFGLGFL
jgi:hypothetical protein